MRKRRSMTRPNGRGSTPLRSKMTVSERYRQKSVSASAICPNLLCVPVCLAINPSRISVPVPHRKTASATVDGVVRPPKSLPSRYEAANARIQVSLLANPMRGNRTPLCTARLRPRCQNKSPCCHTTQKTNPGRRENVSLTPSNRLLPIKARRANNATKQLNRRHEECSEGLSYAVCKESNQERRKNLPQARRLK